MKNRFMFALLGVLLSISGMAYAADGDIYADAYTSESSSGVWTFTGQKTNVFTVDAPSETTSSVTAARTGGTWVLRARTGPAVGGVGYTFALPAAESGLKYTFVTATNQSVSVRTNGTDQIYYSIGAGTKRITSPASTGTTVTVVGVSGGWYVQNMWNAGGASNWTVATS